MPNTTPAPRTGTHRNFNRDIPAHVHRLPVKLRIQEALELPDGDFCNHSSDLYVVNRPGVRDWLQRNYLHWRNVSVFVSPHDSGWNGAGTFCLDIPFGNIADPQIDYGPHGYPHRPGYTSNPEIDCRIFCRNWHTRNAVNQGAPAVGDFVVIDNRPRRFTYFWGREVTAGETWFEFQLDNSGPDTGSYYLSKSGHLSYSGSLDNSKTMKLTRAKNPRVGSCWIFSGGEWGAGRGVHARLPFAVWVCQAEK